MGNLFCPVIASYITGFVRGQLYQFMRDHNLEQNVVAFATGSIAVRRKIPIPVSDRLGEMKLDECASNVYFLSNGFYRFNGKWKQRGVGYDYEKKVEIEHVQTRIGKDGQLYIGLQTTKTVHIKTGIRYNKLDEVNKIVEYEKKINLNSDTKRVWNKDLTALDDKSWCNSMPWDIAQIVDIVVKKDIQWNEGDDKYEPESDL